MDKQVINDIKKIVQGILIYDLLGILILMIIMKATLATVGGLLLGSFTSIVALVMIARNVIGLVEREKVKASLTATAGYSARLLMYAAVLIFAAKTAYVNVFTTFFGLISVSLVIKVQQLILKKRG